MINKKNVQAHIESRIDFLISQLPDVKADCNIRKLRDSLDMHLVRNFMPSYTREEIAIIELAFINYWTNRISLNELYTRIHTIAGDSADKVVDTCYYNEFDYLQSCYIGDDECCSEDEDITICPWDEDIINHKQIVFDFII